MYNDEILIECINASGYYEYQDVNIDDLPNDKRVSIILAGELLAMRPELKNSDDSDVVYIMETILENGSKSYGLPTKDLISLLSKQPFDDASIWTYSVNNSSFINKLYRGTGTKWERL